MKERFVSERIRPDAGDGACLKPPAPGAPALPRAFRWGEQRLELAALVSEWKDTSPCRHGSGERYVRKHWFEAVSVDGRRVKLYMDRQAQTRNPKARWWLFSIEENEGGEV